MFCILVIYISFLRYNILFHLLLDIFVWAHGWCRIIQYNNTVIIVLMTCEYSNASATWKSAHRTRILLTLFITLTSMVPVLLIQSMVLYQWSRCTKYVRILVFSRSTFPYQTRTNLGKCRSEKSSIVNAVTAIYIF